MEERIRPTRSGLFAIELLVAVGIFTFCAAVCVGIFVRAELMSRDSADLNRAVNAARSAAECYKAAGGDLAKTAELCGGTLSENGVALAFDADWNPAVSAPDNGFTLTLSPLLRAGVSEAALAVTRSGEETPLVTWEVAALPEAAP